MGLLPLSYRRPEYVDDTSFQQSRSSLAETTKTESSLRSSKSNAGSGIPDSLSFDRIMDDGTCPPCTKRDFMNYLVYIERSAENLQFYIWYKDFEQRFKKAPASDTALAPEWTKAQADDAVSSMQKETFSKQRNEPSGAEIFKGTDFEKKKGHQFVVDGTNPFSTPPRTPAGDQESMYTTSNSAPSSNLTFRSQAGEAFAAAGVKQPFTIQPFREEVDRVIATYIMNGASRQLNLSDREQKLTMRALEYTTHPSAFRAAAQAVETALRRQAHPNFIRWSICNGNPARVLFARALGVTLIVGAFAAAIVLTLSRVGRGWRALAAIGWVLGISTLVAAYKGMCVVLHGMHHRHVRPWELFVDEEGLEANEKRSFDSFGSSNSYEDEPWIVKYEKRNVVRKIFDREVWIKEPALRQIQDTIFVQAMLSSVLLAGVLSAIFVAVPGGNFF